MKGNFDFPGRVSLGVQIPSEGAHRSEMIVPTIPK
jgi:hypothetical protein